MVVGINLEYNALLFIAYFFVSSQELKKWLSEIQEMLERLDVISFVAIAGIITIQAIGYHEGFDWYVNRIMEVLLKEYWGILSGYISGLFVWNYFGGMN